MFLLLARVPGRCPEGAGVLGMWRAALRSVLLWAAPAKARRVTGAVLHDIHCYRPFSSLLS